jgi:hypothetical protein
MSTDEGRLEEISLIIGKLEKRIQEDLHKCYMCTRDYGDTGVVAKLFHCGHHICKKCLVSQLRSNRVFICGFCRYSITASTFCKQVPTKRFKLRTYLSSITGIRGTQGFGLARLLGISDPIKPKLSLNEAVENLPDYLPIADNVLSPVKTRNEKPRFKFRTYLTMITGIQGTHGFGIFYILGLSKTKPFYYKFFV